MTWKNDYVAPTRRCKKCGEDKPVSHFVGKLGVVRRLCFECRRDIGVASSKGKASGHPLVKAYEKRWKMNSANDVAARVMRAGIIEDEFDTIAEGVAWFERIDAIARENGAKD